MKVIKKTDEYTVYQKRSGRYAVQDATGKALNAEDKIKVLLAEELIKLAVAKAPEPEVEEASDEAAEETAAE